MFEILILIEDDIIGYREMYGIPDEFLLHVPRAEDRVAFGPAGSLAVYEKDLHVGLRFPRIH